MPKPPEVPNPEASANASPDAPKIIGLGHELNAGEINLMTQETYERLLKSIPLVEDEANKANLQKGEAAGSNSDWHDNPTYDQAILDARMAETKLGILQAKLAKVVIIEPRQETDTVGLGNEVVLRFEDEDSDERFLLLGPDDAVTGKDKEPRWISQETPIGQAILGKSAGTNVIVRTPSGETKVKIKKILPGTF